MILLAKIYGMESFYKTSTLPPAIMFHRLTVLHRHSVPTSHIQPLCLLCLKPAVRSSQSTAHLLLEAVVGFGSCCNGRLPCRRESPPASYCRYSETSLQSCVCLPKNQRLKLLLHFEKQMSLGNVHFKQLHSFTLQRAECSTRNFPLRAGKERMDTLLILQ